MSVITAPGADAQGFLLRDLDSHECRYPTFRDHEGTRFCAMPVTPDDWRPGKVNGCYCAFHRAHLDRQPRVTENERQVA